MAEPVIGRVAAARGFVAQIWKLAAPYWWSEEKWLARGLLAVIIGMAVFLVWLAKLLNAWTRNFFDALQNKDSEAFWSLLISFDRPSACSFSFTGLVFVYLVIAVYRLWLRQYLTIRWRRWLTEVYFKDWLAD